jgi:hypothetical protein
MTQHNYKHKHRCKVGYHDWECENEECYGLSQQHRNPTTEPSKTRTCPSCMKKLHGEKETHESYGMASLSRFQSTGSRFFGSSVTFSGGMGLDICTASKTRNLNSDHYYDEKLLLRVRFSPAQFAELITTPNAGGVPCTIEYYNGEQMDDPPEVAIREQYVNEFEEKVQKAFKDLGDLTAEIENYFKTGKGSRVEIREKLRSVRQELQANAPYILDQFNEGMDKIVTEAKAEVDSFTEAKIRSLGIEKLTEQVEALRLPSQTPALQLSEGEDISTDTGH